MQRTWSTLRSLIFPLLVASCLTAIALAIETHTQYRFNWPRVVAVLIGAGGLYAGVIMTVQARRAEGEFFPDDGGFTLVFRSSAWGEQQQYNFIPEETGWSVQPELSEAAQTWLRQNKAELSFSVPERQMAPTSDPAIEREQPETASTPDTGESSASSVDETETDKKPSDTDDFEDADESETVSETAAPSPDRKKRDPETSTDEPVDVDDSELSIADRTTLVAAGQDLSSEESRILDEIAEVAGDWAIEQGDGGETLRAVFEQDDETLFVRRFDDGTFGDPLGAAYDFVNEQRSKRK